MSVGYDYSVNLQPFGFKIDPLEYACLCYSTGNNFGEIVSFWMTPLLMPIWSSCIFYENVLSIFLNTVTVPYNNCSCRVSIVWV